MIGVLKSIHRAFRPSLGFRSLGRWVLLGVLVGTASGLGAAAFAYLLELTGFLVFDVAAGAPRLHPAGEGLFHAEGPFVPVPWLIFLLPAIGGLLSGIVVQRFAPEAAGVGTEALIDSFHKHRGRIRPVVPLVKAIGTLFTLGFGGASGREGPIAQIGGGFGSILADLFKMKARDRRILLLAGAAGGFGAIFRAPLGGAVTAVEVLYREDLETDALVPCVISSVTAYAIFAGIFGFQPIFALPHDLTFTRPHELLFYLVLGILCMPVGALTVKAFWGIHALFERMKMVPVWALPAVGGLLLGVVGLVAPGVYGSGWGTIQQAIAGDMLIGTMLMLLLGKIVAMGLTLGSGGSGGVFGPTLFIGAMLGGVFGYGAALLFPDLAPDPAAVVIVGMCAFFAGVANAPLGALLMTLELSRSYGLIAPLMLVSVIAVLFTSRWSIFRNQVANKFHSPAHQGDLNVDVLRSLRVSEVMHPAEDIVTVPVEATVPEVRKLAVGSQAICFPVVSRIDHRLVGIISSDQVRAVLFEKDLDDLLLAGDLMGPPVSVLPDAHLHDALLTILKSGYGEVPVAQAGDDRLVGILRHTDLLRAYNLEIVRQLEEEAG
jgi:chloride channel protein, CIC family